MSIHDPNEVIKALEEDTSKATEAQNQLADKLGVIISNDLPKIVFAAKLRAKISMELLLKEPDKSPCGLIAFAEKLAIKLKYDAVFKPDISRDELDSWINFFWKLQNLNNLQENGFCVGDIVSLEDDPGNTLYIISSFSKDGLVFFKGGKNKAWAGKLIMQSREKDNDPTLLSKALNNIELHSKSYEWTLEKEKDLKQYEIKDDVQEYMAEELREALGQAKDEKPLQKIIETYPQLLGAIMTGRPKYLIPQKRLGSEFVPDFLIADVDSNGISWILVEIETPHSGICMNSGNDFDMYARKGISQIDEWRDWLMHNLAYATSSIKDNKGLGLTGIRPDCDGLLLVGRRSLLNENGQTKRKQLWKDKRIRIRTYDGLIESVVNRINFGHHPLNSWFLKEENDNPWKI